MNNKIILLALAFSISSTYGKTSRNWTLNNGHNFKASFIEVKSGSVTLEMEDGKPRPVPIANIGVADRYYLHTQHEVAIEELDGGNFLTAERDLKVDLKKFKIEKNIILEGDGYEARLEAIITPNHLILHDKGAKVAPYVDLLERIEFSHSYRMPSSGREKVKKRKTYLFLKDLDIYSDLGKVYVEQLRAQGKLSSKKINQLEADWSQYPGKKGWIVPKNIAEKYNASQKTDVEFVKTGKDLSKDLARFAYRKWDLYPHKRKVNATINNSSTVKLSKDPLQSAAFSYTTALNFSNMIRLFGGIENGEGRARDKSGLHLIGFYGEPKKWGNEISSKVKSGKVKGNFDSFYAAPSNDERMTKKDKYREFGLKVAALGRFLDQDIRHQINVCKLYDYMRTKNTVPTVSKFSELFGYSSEQEMNVAFEKFIISKNTRIKY